MSVSSGAGGTSGTACYQCLRSPCECATSRLVEVKIGEIVLSRERFQQACAKVFGVDDASRTRRNLEQELFGEWHE